MRVSRSKGHDHYYSEEPKTGHALREIREEVRGVSLTLLTDAGVFSRGRIDFGTRLLIETVPLPQVGPILDLGCGYGPIGITLAKLLPHLVVYMSDPNRRAASLAQQNAERNGAANVRIYVGEGYTPFPPEVRFGAIVTNPPIRAGKRVVYGLVEGARERLLAGGTLTCVAQTKQGAKSLRAHIESVFGNVAELEKDGGYRVFHAVLGP